MFCVLSPACALSGVLYDKREIIFVLSEAPLPICVAAVCLAGDEEVPRCEASPDCRPSTALGPTPLFFRCLVSYNVALGPLYPLLRHDASYALQPTICFIHFLFLVPTRACTVIVYSSASSRLFFHLESRSERGEARGVDAGGGEGGAGFGLMACRMPPALRSVAQSRSCCASKRPDAFR